GPLAEQMAQYERVMEQVSTSLSTQTDLGSRLSTLFDSLDWSALQGVRTPVGAKLDLRWQVDTPAARTEPITIGDVTTLVSLLVALSAVGAFASEGQQGEALALCSALLVMLADQWRRSE